MQPRTTPCGAEPPRLFLPLPDINWGTGPHWWDPDAFYARVGVRPNEERHGLGFRPTARGCPFDRKPLTTTV